jgi:tetratricopeptide (TPR) repeat protein
VKALDESDRRYLKAAEGWLELGDWDEGRKQLVSVSQAAQTHPEVLRVVLEFLMARSQWEAVAQGATALCRMEPDWIHGWFFRAAALNRLGRVNEAKDVVMGVVDRFPGAFPLYYALAAYYSQLGSLEEAARWWRRVVELRDDIAEIASEDPDLCELRRAGLLVNRRKSWGRRK